MILENGIRCRHIGLPSSKLETSVSFTVSLFPITKEAAPEAEGSFERAEAITQDVLTFTLLFLLLWNYRVTFLSLAASTVLVIELK